ncbi:MAG: M17 family peptidase N-terminal domain-containing protein, partial [Gemmatimonadota bacterium]
MELRVTRGSVTEVETPALVVNCYQASGPLSGATGAVDEALDGQLSALLTEGEITGRLEEVTLLHTAGRLPARRVLVVGLGPRATCDLEALRRAMGVATRRLLQHKITSFHTILHGGGDLAATGVETRDLAQALAEAAVLAGYRCDAYKTVGEEADGDAPRPTPRL